MSPGLAIFSFASRHQAANLSQKAPGNEAGTTFEKQEEDNDQGPMDNDQSTLVLNGNNLTIQQFNNLAIQLFTQTGCLPEHVKP